jgi:DNA-nicking Smr family endonuclease
MTDGPLNGARSRLLSAEELELWSIVTADVRPSRPRPARSRPETPAAPARSPAVSAADTARPKPEARRKEPPIADIDHRTRTKLRRGQLEVDAKLDLHGLRQDEAQRALIEFLRRAQANGAKMAIVVTGKGQRAYGLSGADGGVLRRMAPMWLQAPALRDVVVSYGEAARLHGGEGALYVRIRRRDRVERTRTGGR